MVDLEAWEEMADARAEWWVCMCNHYNLLFLVRLDDSRWYIFEAHLVAAFEEGGGEHVNVVLDAANIRVEEIGDHPDAG